MLITGFGGRGPGPIGARESGEGAVSEGAGGGGSFVNMTLISCYLLQAKRVMSTIPLSRTSL